VTSTSRRTWTWIWIWTWTGPRQSTLPASAEGALLGFMLLVCLLGCATASSFAPPSAPFRVTSNVSDAEIWVDDDLVGRVSDLTKSRKRLRAGFHRVEIRAPGYYSSFHELEVTGTTPVTLQAPLHQLLD